MKRDGHGEAALLELWGGLECTVARIGDAYRDQLEETGHRARADDLARVAELGVRALRYPVLWETCEAASPRCDWAFHDERLETIRSLGIRPIVGLIHHGSGPPRTNLLDPDFPAGLAAHAGRVAERYPWLEDYTPVNEPLTTARFSCLYGHWFPHAHSERDFLTALVQQCLATVFAMRAIRRVNPGARLIQTDDLGRVFSTPTLAYQEDYENERRWLTFDLLFGRVDRDHPFWPVLLEHGIAQAQLETFLEGDAAPDVVGINHYLTSDRYLDERLHLYPAHLAGGNAFTRYADVEAVRMDPPPGALGPEARLREAWERYRSPMAVTEAHHGCTRDEQLRWLAEVWRSAEALRREGADLRAVTVWSLFGTVDWNTLLTGRNGIYEPGAFDVRGPEPRPTALAHAARALAAGGDFDHAVLDVPGWWRRPDHRYGRLPGDDAASGPTEPRTVLIVGRDSPARRAFERLATMRGLACRSLDPAASPKRLTDMHEDARLGRVWAVLDLTGLSEGGQAAQDRRRREDALGLAGWCARTGRAFVAILPGPTVDASAHAPLREDDDRATAGFGTVEQQIAAAAPDALLIRTGPLFGPWEPDPVVAPLLTALANNRPVAAGSGLVSPTYLPDLVHVAFDLLIDGATGVWHLANPDAVPAKILAAGLADRLGRSRSLVRPARTVMPAPALATGRGQLMPPLGSALDRYVDDCAFAIEADPTASIAAE